MLDGAAAARVAPKAAPGGLYATLIDLGELYSRMRKDVEALTLFKGALTQVRVHVT